MSKMLWGDTPSPPTYEASILNPLYYKFLATPLYSVAVIERTHCTYNHLTWPHLTFALLHYHDNQETEIMQMLQRL